MDMFRSPPASSLAAMLGDELDVPCNQKIFIGNLTWETAWWQLKEHVQQVAEPQYVKILKDSSGRSKGCGIITFRTPEEATAARVRLDGSQLQGRSIQVREVRDSRDGGFSGLPGMFGPSEGRTIVPTDRGSFGSATPQLPPPPGPAGAAQLRSPSPPVGRIEDANCVRRVYVESSVTAMIIGKGGAGIKQIAKDAGPNTHIKHVKEGDRGYFLVRAGTDEAADRARDLIRQAEHRFVPNSDKIDEDGTWTVTQHQDRVNVRSSFQPVALARVPGLWGPHYDWCQLPFPKQPRQPGNGEAAPSASQEERILTELRKLPLEQVLGPVKIGTLLRRVTEGASSKGEVTTLLHVACEQRWPAVARWLLSKGADVNATRSTVETEERHDVTSSKSQRELTPLHIAAKLQDRDLVDLLLEHSADPTKFAVLCTTRGKEIQQRVELLPYSIVPDDSHFWRYLFLEKQQPLPHPAAASVLQQHKIDTSAANTRFLVEAVRVSQALVMCQHYVGFPAKVYELITQFLLYYVLNKKPAAPPLPPGMFVLMHPPYFFQLQQLGWYA